ncbi:hypothetical protein [Saccharopolyspora phatthalungensis]|uniref:Uncharacterized protein n=1 Tax=Saccharopolyspora phatthalungensis TaxID=664693 RepID=A0A840QIX3_9PSEU|nr:hypothetical protein [Saccharopolyspora phatthalungensis]MBB5157433.1 hypothetical protein [Saccharopolyspora phatthalungensis]
MALALFQAARMEAPFDPAHSSYNLYLSPCMSVARRFLADDESSRMLAQIRPSGGFYRLHSNYEHVQRPKDEVGTLPREDVAAFETLLADPAAWQARREEAHDALARYIDDDALGEVIGDNGAVSPFVDPGPLNDIANRLGVRLWWLDKPSLPPYLTDGEKGAS